MKKSSKINFHIIDSEYTIFLITELAVETKNTPIFILQFTTNILEWNLRKNGL